MKPCSGEIEKRVLCLRPETDQDKNFLLKLYFTTRDTALKQSGWPQPEIQAFLTQQFEAQHLSYRQLYPHAAYQLIERHGEPIGRLYLQRGEDDYRLIDISLLPAFQNRSLGRQLIQSILDEAAEAGKPVSLHVEQLNPAYRLYERMGFKQVEERGPHLYMQWRPDKEVG